MVKTFESQPARSAFAALLGTAFRFRVGEGRSVELTLTGVTSTPAPEGWERFALLFDGPEPSELPSDTYLVDHESLGSFPLSVGPVQALGQRPCYEAVFNRPVRQRSSD
jgi:hypothetical protein